MADLNQFDAVPKAIPTQRNRNGYGIFEINAPFKNLGGLAQLIPFKSSKRVPCKNKVLVERLTKDQTRVVSSVERRKANNFSVSFLSHNNRNLKVIAEHPNSNFGGIKALLEYNVVQKEPETQRKSTSRKLNSQNSDFEDEIFSPSLVKRNMQSIGTQMTARKSPTKDVREALSFKTPKSKTRASMNIYLARTSKEPLLRSKNIKQDHEEFIGSIGATDIYSERKPKPDYPTRLANGEFKYDFIPLLY